MPPEGASTRPLAAPPMATPIRSAEPSVRDNCDTCLLKTTRGVEKWVTRRISRANLRDDDVVSAPNVRRVQRLPRELKVFARRNRHRMRYVAVLKKQGLPIAFRSQLLGRQRARSTLQQRATLEERPRNALGRARRPSHARLYPSRVHVVSGAVGKSNRLSSEPGPCSHIPTRRRLRALAQCRADTQLAMTPAVSPLMRVTHLLPIPNRF